MMRVAKQRKIAFDPQTGTLWVDEAGEVYFLHYIGMRGDLYQVTHLASGMPHRQGEDKVPLVAGMCPYRHEVVISNA